MAQVGLPDIGLFEAIYSARSIRRLKPDPVPEELITQDPRCRDPRTVGRQCSELGLCRCARPGSEAPARRHLPQGVRHRRGRLCRSRPPASPDRAAIRPADGRRGLSVEPYGRGAVLLLPCARRPMLPAREALPPDIAARWEDEVAYTDRIRGASIYPAVQNIILACRAVGLGTLITTNHIRCEDEVRALLRHPRRRLDLGADADRLADRQVRTPDPPPARRGGPRRPLGGSPGPANDGRGDRSTA